MSNFEQRYRELQDKRATLEAEFHEISNDSQGNVVRGERLTKGIEKIDAEVEKLKEEERAMILRRAANPGNTEAGSDTGIDDSYTRDALNRPTSDAQRVIDRCHDRGDIPDHAAQRASEIVRSGGVQERGVAARWASVASDDAYLRAFGKTVADPVKGHLLWTPDELRAYQAVEEFRAMSLTDTAGGFMVPFQLDPSILLSSAGSINPLRQISRVVTATGDTWHGVSSAGVTAEWIAEAAEVADATPALAQPSVPVHKGDAFVPYSFEVGMDAVDLLGELAPLLTDAADQLQATAFTTGTGSGQPTGIIKALDGGASEVAPTTAEVFAAADVYKLQNALPPRFQGRAQWCANIAILNTMSQFETTNGARLFPELGDGRLLRKPINELSNMDGAIDPAATADNFVLLYGDFTHFVIADRIGTTLEPIPNLFGANQRPTGQRGAFMWFRTGSDSVVDNAFRVLNVATTA